MRVVKILVLEVGLARIGVGIRVVKSWDWGRKVGLGLLTPNIPNPNPTQTNSLRS